MIHKTNEKDMFIINKWEKIFDLDHKDMLNELKKLDLNEKTSNNENILHIACKSSKKEAIENILKLNNNLINLKDTLNNWTPIYYIIESSDSGEPEILNILLKSGAKINIQDNNGLCPLHLMSFKGQDENINLLLKFAPDLNITDKLGRVPLTFAIIEGQLNSAYILLDAGADYKIIDNKGNTLLHYAVNSKGNSLLFSIMLIDRKINVNLCNFNGDTALMLIAKNNPKENVRLIKKLINSGAIYENIINDKCQSFLSLMGEAAIKDKFYKKFIDINYENNKALLYNVNKLKMQKKNNNNNNDKLLTYKILPIILLLLSFLIKYMK